MYVVFARKYRPRRFEDVVGQEHIARTLQNALENGRVAHAYLFCGSRGVGKTTMARILAKALNCEEGPTSEPCCECEACRRISTGDFIDVREIDGASNRGIDQIRELRSNVGYSPSQSRFKIYYIDEVHMLTVEAFNALLKTLEEPPSHVKFIFSTTDPQQLPDTVKSRCQRFDFRRISDAHIEEYLDWVCDQEGLEPEQGSLRAMARAARGSLRDALSTLDQVASFSDQQVRREDVLQVLGAVEGEVLSGLVDALAAEDTGTALSIVNRVLYAGTDVADFADQLSEYLRDLLVASHCGAEAESVGGSAADAETLARQADRFTTDQLAYALQLLREAKRRAKRDTLGRLAVELAIVKMSRLSDLVDLEQALSGGGPQQGQPQPASGGTAASGGSRATGGKQGGTQKGGDSGGVSESARATLRNMKEKLNGGGSKKKAETTETKEPAPDGVDTTSFRKIQSVAENQSTARGVRQDRNLLDAFAQADSAFGLHPVKLVRRNGEETDQDAENRDET
ncbi:MAG: DNA polymerase III subunit gamma/tau [Planctomycetota bacterium]